MLDEFVLRFLQLHTHNWYRYKSICTQKSFHETKGMFQGWTQMIMAGFFAAVRSFGSNVVSIGNFVLIAKKLERITGFKLISWKLHMKNLRWKVPDIQWRLANEQTFQVFEFFWRFLFLKLGILIFLRSWEVLAKSLIESFKLVSHNWNGGHVALFTPNLVRMTSIKYLYLFKVMSFSISLLTVWTGFFVTLTGPDVKINIRILQPSIDISVSLFLLFFSDSSSCSAALFQ